MSCVDPSMHKDTGSNGYVVYINKIGGTSYQEPLTRSDREIQYDTVRYLHYHTTLAHAIMSMSSDLVGVHVAYLGTY